MVYVVVLNWNGASDTIVCLKSLARLHAPLPKVLVCDNASTDDSWARLQDYASSQNLLDIQLINTGANLGFSGGNNVGLRAALSDPAMEFVWILNNDTEVAPDALAALMRYMNGHPNAGICGSTLLYMHNPEYIQAVGGQYNLWLGTSRHVLGKKRYTRVLCQSVDPLTLDYVVGASMFVRRSVLENVGLMSEDFFLYSEEIDWAYRLKRCLPAQTLGYAPESLVYHKEGASTGSNDWQEKAYSYLSDYFFITSRLKFARKLGSVYELSVQGSMLLVSLNRVRRRQWRSAMVALCCFCGVIPKFLEPRGLR